MKTADLTQYPSAEYFTVQVHNFKDDPDRESASLHGLFTDASLAATVAAVIEQSWSGFIRATVVPIRIGTVEQVAAAQRISHIESNLPADFGDAQATEHATERDPVADAIALAEVVHEADWTMAGPRWPWYQATGAQREDALLIAQNAIADPGMDDDALEALVERLWSTKPKHGAPRRISAKASKVREWLISEGLREGGIDRPSDRP